MKERDKTERLRRIRATFGSLRSRNYRLFFMGQAISVIGTWVQKIAQAWLVLELTGSGTLLGITAALQHLPTLMFAPLGGLLADRVDKRKILIGAGVFAGALALVLGILVATEVVQLWMVLILALLLGTGEALEKPTRHAFVLDMIDPSQLVNAVTLNSVVQNCGKIIGPAIAGAVISSFGLGPSFMINSASYIGVVAGLGFMRKGDLNAVLPVPRARRQIREGLAYVRQTPALLGPLLFMTVTGMMAWEWQVMFPLMARDAFDGDAQTLSLMFSAMGVGAVVGGLLIAGGMNASFWRMFVAALAFSATVGLTAIAPTLPVALVATFFIGWTGMVFRAIATSLVQLTAAPEMRGRVMALLVVSVGGTTPIGGPLVGWIGEMFGPRIAVGQGGLITAIAAFVMLWYLRKANVLTSSPLGR